MEDKNFIDEMNKQEDPTPKQSKHTTTSGVIDEINDKNNPVLDGLLENVNSGETPPPEIKKDKRTLEEKLEDLNSKFDKVDTLCYQQSLKIKRLKNIISVLCPHKSISKGDHSYSCNLCHRQWHETDDDVAEIKIRYIKKQISNYNNELDDYVKEESTIHPLQMTKISTFIPDEQHKNNIVDGV